MLYDNKQEDKGVLIDATHSKRRFLATEIGEEESHTVKALNEKLHFKLGCFGNNLKKFTLEQLKLKFPPDRDSKSSRPPLDRKNSTRNLPYNRGRTFSNRSVALNYWATAMSKCSTWYICTIATNVEMIVLHLSPALI